MNQPKRAVLRYHGGKWRLAPWIISHFPDHRVYVEPYGGAASVLMRKHPSHAEVYNDLDEDVVNLFRVLRDQELAERLRTLLELTPFSRKEFEASYEPSPDPVEQARRTVARCYMAFGSTSRRRNRTGFRAKPHRKNTTGVQDWRNYPDSVPAVVERFRNVVVECKPAIEVIKQQDGDETLFYVDPPYPIETRSSIRWPSENDRAYAHDLTEDDHRELAQVLHECRGGIILSGYPCDLYDRDLYPDWFRTEKEALADGAQRRTEVLYINAKAQCKGQESLFA